jgi:glycine betaine catabolism B
MNDSFLRQFDGYDRIADEKAAAQKLGTGLTYERATTQEYINRLHPKELTLTVSRLIDETPTTRTLRLVPTDLALPPFLPGQYTSVTVTVGGVRTGRPFSISSAPDRIAYWDLTVRRVEGGLVSNYLLDRVKEGDTMSCSGPAGNFYVNPLVHEKTIVAIAGGSGVTPFMSMIREAVDYGRKPAIFLFYGNRGLDDVIFHDELTRIARSNRNIRYIPVIESPPKGYAGQSGYISADVIKNEIGDVMGKTFFLCGPQAMYDFCLPELAKLGVPKRKIRREMYGTPAKITGYPGWPSAVKEGDTVSVKVRGKKTITAPATTPLLTTLENNGIIVPFLCRSGECSMCRVKVLTGTVYQPPGTPVRKSDTQFGYVHSCVSYPVEDIEILL